VETGLALIQKAAEKEQEDRIFQQWVVQVPYMDEKTFVGFEAYKDKLTGANIDRRSVAEIEADLEEVERQLQRGGDA
jgi:hypothetical protein